MAARWGAFQLRLKDVTDDEVRRAGEVILPICHEYGVQFILNDKVHLVSKLGANGVHVGGDDGDVAEIRSIIGNKAVLGVSCYASKDRAISAGEGGADYVSFGAFYETKTKEPKGRPDPDILTWWSSYAELPCAAIGGIKPNNCGVLVEAGADFVAVVSYVWEHKDGPGRAVAEFNKAIGDCV